MKSLNRALCVLVTLTTILLPTALSAQVEKVVEVSKSYSARLQAADKIAIEPDFTDTVRLTPEIDYRLTPRAVNTPLSNMLFQPARLTYWEFNRARPLYLKAGLGYPFNSEGDLYLTTQHPDIGYATLLVNHHGDYSRIRNLAEQKADATQLYNRIGAAAGKRFGRSTLEGAIDYENRLDHRYGAIDPSDDRMVGARVHYGRLNARVRVGNDFEQQEKVNYNLELHTRYLHDNSTTPQPEQGRQLDGGASGYLGLRIRGHQFGLRGSFEGAWGRKDWSQEKNLNTKVGLCYHYNHRVFDAVIGADYLHSNILTAEQHRKYNYILPDLQIRFNIGKGALVPYLRAGGEVEQNDFGHLVEQNPYIRTGLSLPKNSVSYNLRLGIDGAIGSRFAYTLYGQVSWIENANYWYATNYYSDEATSRNFLLFDAVQGRRNMATLGAELRWRPGRDWLVEMGARGYGYDLSAAYEDIELCTGLPNLEAELKVGYTHERFTIRAAAEMTSCRYWSRLLMSQTSSGAVVVAHDTFQAPITVDLGLYFDYHLSQSLTLYAEGRNLLNQRLYEWSNFPSRGIRFTAGVKMSF